MPHFLFWNLNQKPLAAVVARLALRYDVDVLMLVENSTPPAALLHALNAERVSYHYAPGIGCTRIEVFARFSGQFIRPIHEADRLTVRRLRLPGLPDLLLVVTHFPSKLYWSDESQAAECMRLADDIRSIEARVGHSRTVLVGDLNMNPFESGMVAASGLHGVMSQTIARRESRNVQQQAHPFFL